MKEQVIKIDGTFYKLDQAFNGLQNIIAQTNTLQDHPDMTKMYNAKEILLKLHGSNILSTKADAIIAYEIALRNIYTMTVDEE